jgi:signal transduction histidine kinase
METAMDTTAWDILRGTPLAAKGLNRIVMDCVAREQIEAALADRVRFETLLADLSATFSRDAGDTTPLHIQNGLQRVVEFLGIDSITLLEFSKDRTHLHAIQSYTAPGLLPYPAQALDHFPWCTERLRHGQAVCFARLTELPAEAWAEQESCRRAGCRSGLMMPLVIDGEVGFVMSFRAFRAERRWPAELIPQLRLIGEVFANVISRKRSAEANHQLHQELGHVTRAIMLGELAATLAHELARPLAAILSNAQAAHRFLTMASPQLEEVQEGLQDVIAETRRAADILQRLRALAQKADVQWTRFDVNEMIREVMHLVSAEASTRGVSMTLQLHDDLPPVCGDRIQLQQVALNLILNAFEAIAEANERPRQIVVRTGIEPRKGITVAVQDSGIGLQDNALQRMFDPLFSTKATGMGMGLAISRSIITAHQGRIWATPHPGGGATVSFSLPTDMKEMA